MCFTRPTFTTKRNITEYGDQFRTTKENAHNAYNVNDLLRCLLPEVLVSLHSKNCQHTHQNIITKIIISGSGTIIVFKPFCVSTWTPAGKPSTAVSKQKVREKSWGTSCE